MFSTTRIGALIIPRFIYINLKSLKCTLHNTAPLMFKWQQFWQEFRLWNKSRKVRFIENVIPVLSHTRIIKTQLKIIDRILWHDCMLLNHARFGSPCTCGQTPGTHAITEQAMEFKNVHPPLHMLEFRANPLSNQFMKEPRSKRPLEGTK